MSIKAIEPISIGAGETDTRRLAQAFGDCFARYGFAIVSDHGIPQVVIDQAFAWTRRFFDLPEEVKRAYTVPGGAGQRGYTPFGIETAKGAVRADLKEFWHLGRDLPSGYSGMGMPRNLSVTEMPAFDTATRQLFKEMDDLGLKILRAIAVYLGQPVDFFQNKVAMGNSILRLLHYPPLAPDAQGVRADAHEDINVITLLLGAEEAGLQLLDRDGCWLDVDPPPGCVVVNIGDMLQRLTNHVLPSTTHRVINPTPARAGFSRYSMPFFQHFVPDYLIETLPSCISAARANRYPVPITANDYLHERLTEIKLAVT